jgi:hypothetical protein
METPVGAGPGGENRFRTAKQFVNSSLQLIAKMSFSKAVGRLASGPLPVTAAQGAPF